MSILDRATPGAAISLPVGLRTVERSATAGLYRRMRKVRLAFFRQHGRFPAHPKRTTEAVEWPIKAD